VPPQSWRRAGNALENAGEVTLIGKTAGKSNFTVRHPALPQMRLRQAGAAPPTRFVWGTAIAA
jgi:hypothetical protein